MDTPSTDNWDNADIDMTAEQAAILAELDADETAPAPELTEDDKEREARYEAAQAKAVEQIGQMAMFGIQSGARWYCKNPNIVIPKETQQAFIETLPEVLDECEVEAPEFLAKYQARFAMGFIVLGMVADIANQQKQFKQSQLQQAAMENAANDDTYEAASNG